MTEQPQKLPSEDSPPWPTGGPDDSEPSVERQAELRSAYEANAKAGKPPYAGTVIKTRGEVKWIMRERQWRTGGLDTIEQTVDFRNIGLKDADVRDIDLDFADFTGATIVQTNLTGAHLNDVTLSDVKINKSTFAKAELIQADLSGSVIGDSDFSGADLTLANLSNALILDCDLNQADASGSTLAGALLAGNLAGANLSMARMDSATLLGSAETLTTSGAAVRLDAATRVLDVAWNGAILANVDWEKLPRLGDETDIKGADSRVERVRAFRNAARANRGLAKALQAQGLTIPALKFRLREQRFERKSLFWDRKPGQWFFSWLLNLVSGYGDRPGRGILVYLAVIVWFANFYVWAAQGVLTFGLAPSQITSLQWYEALVLSASSFHGRGFFQPLHSLGDPVAILAAFEAVIGLFIEITFIATFTQRFFAR